MENTLKITIITVVFNGQKYIDETLNSVKNQTYPFIEYIVVDGNSIDNTSDIINKYRDIISVHICEADNSMYEAINKGLLLSSGDFILILNSDDYLYDKNTVENVVKYIEDKEGFNAYYGKVCRLKEGVEDVRKSFQVTFNDVLFSNHGTFIPHPCLFVSKKMINTVGLYSLNYKYASDYEYTLKFLKKGVVAKYMPIVTTCFRDHADSITSSGKLDKERKAILIEYGLLSHRVLTQKLYFLYVWLRYKLVNL